MVTKSAATTRGRRSKTDMTVEMKIRGRMTTEQAKDELAVLLSRGASVKDALAVIGRSQSWYETQRRMDPQYKERIATIRFKQGDARGFKPRGPEDQPVVDLGVTDPRTLSFPEFSERFLRHRVFPHIQNVVDLIEHKEPSWKHPAMVFEQGDPDLVIVNMPPEHAKTTSVTINYAVYRIVMDPSVRIIIISKSQAMARKMLLAIKNRLTHPQYKDLIRTYAPAGGFEATADAWTADMIYVGGGDRDVEQKDPTVQAIGIRGHLYGARADLIIMDDCVDLTNASDYDRQLEWIQSEVMSRVTASGALLMVGTRLAPMDLYYAALDGSRYPDEKSPWTYLAMPAVLGFDEDVDRWETLWPRSNVPEPGVKNQQPDADGLYPKWDGPRLAKKRARVTPTVWARVYMQLQVSEDTIFRPEDVRGCVLRSRNIGLIQPGMPGNREEGMAGLVVVAGLDPATTGHTAAAVVALDPKSHRRYVLEVRNRPNMKPDEMREMIFDLTDHYSIVEWVIERNGFQGFLVHDREVNQYLASKGCIVRPHFTGQIKHDEDFGVAAMSALFKGWKEGHNLIELPSSHNSEGVRALIEQLEIWQPKASKHQKTDTVMALWMAELACLQRIQALVTFGRTHSRNPFLSRRGRDRQTVFHAHEVGAWRA